MIAEKQAKKEAEEKAKQEEAQAAAAAKKSSDLAYKKAWKELLATCQETLAGSNYDRFFIEGQQRKLF